MEWYATQMLRRMKKHLAEWEEKIREDCYSLYREKARRYEKEIKHTWQENMYATEFIECKCVGACLKKQQEKAAATTDEESRLDFPRFRAQSLYRQ